LGTASNLIVSPGFIDMHTHSDLTFLLYPSSLSKIMQGVTTEVVGNCGVSLGPVNKSTIDILQHYADSFFGEVSKYLDWKWRTLFDYNQKVERNGIAVNFAQFVGHGTLRIAVGNFQDKISDSELRKMKNLLIHEMKLGAFGLSTGLAYPPGIYSDTSEIIELAKAMKDYNGIYATHIRNEGEHVLESINEAITIGREAGVPVQISHLKVSGKNSWGKSKEITKLIKDARALGVKVHGDVYPYDAGQTGLWACLPSWAQEGGVLKAIERLKDPQTREKIRQEILTFTELPGGQENRVKEAGWEGIRIAATGSSSREVEGKTIKELAEKQGKDPFDVFADLLIQENGKVSMIIHIMNEDDVIEFLKQPFVFIGSDHNGIIPSLGPLGGKQHPRAYGTFPRVLSYFRRKYSLDIGDLIKRMTYLPAKSLGIKDRGFLEVGAKADVVIFSEDEVEDTATFDEPRQFPRGIRYVLVNGQIVVNNGLYTGKLPGRRLRKEIY